MKHELFLFLGEILFWGATTDKLILFWRHCEWSKAIVFVRIASGYRPRNDNTSNLSWHNIVKSEFQNQYTESNL